jgi:hypothetical protein
MQDAIANGLRDIADFVPKFVLFLVILIVGLIIAALIAKALRMLFKRLGFDRLIDRGGMRSFLANARLDAGELIVKVIYYAIVLLVLQFAFGVFGPNPISALLNTIVAYLPRVAVALIIVVIAAAIAGGARNLVNTALAGTTYGRALGTVTYVAILAIGIIAALNQMDIAVTVTTPILVAGLATIAGILIVGVGGGLIGPMSRRWEGYLSRAEGEASRRRRGAVGTETTAPRTEPTATQSTATQPTGSSSVTAEDLSRPRARGDVPPSTEY